MADYPAKPPELIVPGGAAPLSLLHSREVSHPDEEADGEYREAEEGDALPRARIGERENRIRWHALSCSAEVNPDHVHGELSKQKDQIQGRDRENDLNDQHPRRPLCLSHRQLHSRSPPSAEPSRPKPTPIGDKVVERPDEKHRVDDQQPRRYMPVPRLDVATCIFLHLVGRAVTRRLARCACARWSRRFGHFPPPCDRI